MPLVRISLPEQFATIIKENISIAIHQSLIEAFHIPEDDYFQIIEDVKPVQLRFPKTYLGVNYTTDIIFIQIIAIQGRTSDQKKQLYSGIADRISRTTPVNKNNIIISLVENAGFENWSLGNGEMSIAPYLKNDYLSNDPLQV